MRVYDGGGWGLAFIWSLKGSVFPKAFAIAFPNAIFAFMVSMYVEPKDINLQSSAINLFAGFNFVLGFLVVFRNQTGYSRWWEGGTLLQQVRGEWFNAFSSLLAFCSPDEKKVEAVDAFQHILARLMSMLYSAALQQVTSEEGKSFEIIDNHGMDADQLSFLMDQADRVEVILQWVQKLVVENMSNGVLPIPPPVMSRVFQELSRGIVNLQNARKIAEFPFPFPYAQVITLMLLIHWVVCPFLSSLLFNTWWATILSFINVFCFWSINYIALELEMPFGNDENDLPIEWMQRELNKSLWTLLHKKAQTVPKFNFNWEEHGTFRTAAQVSEGLASTKRAQTKGLLSRVRMGGKKDSAGATSQTIEEYDDGVLGPKGVITHTLGDFSKSKSNNSAVCKMPSQRGVRPTQPAVTVLPRKHDEQPITRSSQSTVVARPSDEPKKEPPLSVAPAVAAPSGPVSVPRDSPGEIAVSVSPPVPPASGSNLRSANEAAVASGGDREGAVRKDASSAGDVKGSGAPADLELNNHVRDDADRRRAESGGGAGDVPMVGL